MSNNALPGKRLRSGSIDDERMRPRKRTKFEPVTFIWSEGSLLIENQILKIKLNRLIKELKELKIQRDRGDVRSAPETPMLAESDCPPFRNIATHRNSELLSHTEILNEPSYEVRQYGM
uniref:Uncharacterized protein n=1 Tax=Pararge aegeria TaxID=116150 RepID=S4PS00_9NEOP